MSPERKAFSPVSSWSNGRKAVVHLLQDATGRRLIRKAYRVGFGKSMLGEFAMATYVSSRLSIAPRVLRLKPWRREIWLQYLPGERVLEWVLGRFGDPNLQAADFQSFHGLDPPHNVDPRVALAFERFRATTNGEALQLKHAIRESYRTLHGIGIKHGSADPRNMLYYEGRIYIIDFDNARPSRRAEQIDYRDLEYWYGLRPGGADGNGGSERGDPAL